MADDEHTPDEFGIALLRWGAQEGLLERARLLEEQWDLDPELREALEEAIREDDIALIMGALANLWRAVGEATGDFSALTHVLRALEEFN